MLPEYERILFATDGSESANAALQKAVGIARRNNAKLFVLHVLDSRVLHATSASDHKIQERMKTGGDTIMNRAKDYAAEQGVSDVEILLESGDPKKVIGIDIPERENIDLIVMGAKGTGAMERFFIGSVSENVVRHATCDVLVIR